MLMIRTKKNLCIEIENMPKNRTKKTTLKMLFSCYSTKRI